MEIQDAFSDYRGRGNSVQFNWIDDLPLVPGEVPQPPELPSLVEQVVEKGEMPALLTIRAAADLIATGELSPVELTVSLLERIERINPTQRVHYCDR